ncbi:hypothetical protein ACWIGW_39165 [Nocardia brasiliensis]
MTITAKADTLNLLGEMGKEVDEMTSYYAEIDRARNELLAAFTGAGATGYQELTDRMKVQMTQYLDALGQTKVAGVKAYDEIIRADMVNRGRFGGIGV